MKGKLSTRYLTEDSYAEWNRLVAAAPQGSIYSTPEYLDIICAAAGGRFKILGVIRGDELVGGVALYERDSLFGTYASNRLLLYYNSLIIREYDTRYPSQRTARHLEILTLLEEVLSRTKYARLRLHNRWPLTDLRAFLSRGWSVRPNYTYVVFLDDLDLAWKRIDKNFHRLINRCSERGVTVTEDDDFEALFQLHFQTHVRKGSPLYLGRRAFARYFERLKASGLCRLCHARLEDGRSVAAQLVLLGDHPVCHTVCAGADPEFMNLGTTPLLRWEVFKQLSQLGYEANDLTDAELNPVTRFKSQLGAELKMNLVISRPDKLAFQVSRNVSRLFRRGQSFLRRRMGRETSQG